MSRPRKAWALALVLALAGGSRAGIEVEVAGNERFRSRVLKEAVPPDPEFFEEEELASWREDALFNVEDLYRRDGYFEALVDLELARKPEGGPGDWIATVKVQEGPRYRFDTVRVRVAADTLSAARVEERASAGDTAAGAALARLDSAEAARALPPPDAGEGERPAVAEGQAPPDSPPLPRSVGGHAPADSARYVSPAALGIDLGPEDLKAEAGEPFQEDLLYRDRRYVLRRFGNSGYVRASVEDRIDIRFATKTVSVDYLVTPSYPVIFDTVHIIDRRPPPADTAPGITRLSLIRSLIPYDRGDTVRVSQSDRVIEKLQYTGAFNFVRLKDSLVDPSDGRSALILHAEEHVPGNVRTSVFYETQYGAGVSLDARHSNVAGTLNELRAGGQLAMYRQSAYGGYGSPLTFGRLVRFDHDVDVNWLQDKEVHDELDQGLFDGDFRGVSSTRLTVPWSYWLNLVGNAEVEGKSRLLDTATRERHLNLNFIETAAIAFLNQSMDPTRGMRFALTWGNGGPLWKNDRFRIGEFRHNWVEARTSQYWYYPPLRQFKLATRLDGGRFFGNGEANSERFFLGGSRSVRSYGYQGLCTEKSDQEVCVGEDKTLAYALASAELRMELFGLGFIGPRSWLKSLIPLQTVPFVDFGKVWEVGRDFTLAREEDGERKLPAGQGYGWGLGFRYPLLGIFNLRVDILLGGSGPMDFWIDLAQAF